TRREPRRLRSAYQWGCAQSQIIGAARGVWHGLSAATRRSEPARWATTLWAATPVRPGAAGRSATLRAAATLWAATPVRAAALRTATEPVRRPLRRLLRQGLDDRARPQHPPRRPRGGPVLPRLHRPGRPEVAHARRLRYLVDHRHHPDRDEEIARCTGSAAPPKLVGRSRDSHGKRHPARP